eukprot:1159067-Pelagomonas_calceolata.AAC.18
MKGSWPHSLSTGQFVAVLFTPRKRLKEHKCLFCNWHLNSLPSVHKQTTAKAITQCATQYLESLHENILDGSFSLTHQKRKRVSGKSELHAHWLSARQHDKQLVGLTIRAIADH